MSRVAAHGLSLDAKAGWDVRIYKRTAEAPAVTHPILHAGNFGLPEARGDYGSGAVEVMAASNVFIALLEFDPPSATTPLFASRGLGLPLPAVDFDPQRMQRNIPGQSGLQRFFQVGGRAFCLYVVLGSHLRRSVLADLASQALQSLMITDSQGTAHAAARAPSISLGGPR